MSRRLRPGRIVRGGWAFLVASLLALVVAGVATAHGGDPALYPARDAGVPVFLVDNGFHTEVAFPAEALAGRPGPTATAVAGQVGRAPWVSVGWGDARFFVEQGLSPARVFDAFRAAFAPNNPSVVRIEGLPQRPDVLYGPKGLVRLKLSEPGFTRLVARIDRSLVSSPQGGARLSDAQPRTPAERFYVSVEHFSLVHLCNHWTGELLNAAGLATTPVLDVLPVGLKLDLRLRDGVSAQP